MFLRVSDLFSNIENEELDVTVLEILSYHPNTGYKMMLGYLNARGIRIQSKLIYVLIRPFVILMGV